MKLQYIYIFNADRHSAFSSFSGEVRNSKTGLRSYSWHTSELLLVNKSGCSEPIFKVYAMPEQTKLPPWNENHSGGSRRSVTALLSPVPLPSICSTSHPSLAFPTPGHHFHIEIYIRTLFDRLPWLQPTPDTNAIMLNFKSPWMWCYRHVWYAALLLPFVHRHGRYWNLPTPRDHLERMFLITDSTASSD